MTITVVDDLAAAAKEAFLLAARAACTRGKCHIALSGGSTPKALYEALGPDDLPWTQIELFFGDERRVPLDDARSNYRMVEEALLARVEVQCHPMVDAAAYEALLRLKLGDAGAFDVMLLGMGEDGHTASLFPGSPALAEHTRWVVEAPGVVPAPERLTFTTPVLQAARQVLVFAGGAGKAAVLQEVLEGPPGRYPVQLLREARGDVQWLLDRPAASQLAPR